VIRLTSLSNCLISNVICLMTRRGASSDNLMINAETDFGPLVSLLLNSLLLKSLQRLINFSQLIQIFELCLPQNLISQLRVIVLLGQNVQKFAHWFCKVLEVRKILDYRSLRSCRNHQRRHSSFLRTWYHQKHVHDALPLCKAL